MIGTLLATALAVAVPAVEPAPASAESQVAVIECPPPKTVAPRYPAQLMVENRTGTVIVAARVDACGLVLETKVARGARHRQFNEAALAAVSGWILTQDQVAGAVDGWVEVPVRFGGVRTVEVREVPWPRSHRRPRYERDDEGTGFATIAAFAAADISADDVPTRAPFASNRDAAGNRISTTLYVDRRDPRMFWFSYLEQPPLPSSATAPAAPTRTLAVARLRLVEEDGEPVVRISSLCEEDADTCAAFDALVLKGMPFAPPR